MCIERVTLTRFGEERSSKTLPLKTKACMVLGRAYVHIIDYMQIIIGVAILESLFENYVASDFHDFVALKFFVARDYLDMTHVHVEHLTCFQFLVVY